MLLGSAENRVMSGEAKPCPGIAPERDARAPVAEIASTPFAGFFGRRPLDDAYDTVRP
ncbi:hypothetical protein D3C87_2206580 [compost metagenome]